jgi:RimJ/RimL family protein N-acetyltransferase
MDRIFNFVMIRVDDPGERIIGSVGVNSLDPCPSVGYGVHPEFWGQGYATEALEGVINVWWKLPRNLVKNGGDEKERSGDEDEDEVEKLYAACNKANVGSVKVLLKNGFRIYTEVPMEGDIVAFMQLERPRAFLTSIKTA